MTLDEMQKAKADTERVIREALNDFMRVTGLAVRGVHMELIESTNLNRAPDYISGEVRLDVRL
jgi:hypothetical protein